MQSTRALHIRICSIYKHLYVNIPGASFKVISAPLLQIQCVKNIAPIVGPLGLGAVSAWLFA